MIGRPTLAFACLGAVLGVACGRPAPTPTPSPPPVVARSPVSFREGDLSSAIEEARRDQKLVFVDAWAPWCHTCLSLREFVLKDPALAPLADRYVFVAIDTERDDSEPFLKAHPMRYWPTLWVLDPASDAALLKWPGSLTTAELVDLLGEVARDRAAGGAMTDLVRADRAVAAGALDDAVSAYEAARAGVARGSVAHARAVSSLVTVLADKDPGRCAEIAAAEAGGLARGTHAANVIGLGLDCSRGEGPASEPLLRLAEALVDDPAGPLLDDDRSALFESLVEAYDHRKDDDRARAIAGRWAVFLEARAARAPNDRARAVFDAHRMLAYLKLDRLDDARQMLERSEALFPDDANPPARLMRVLRRQKRLELAEAAGRRAMQRVYGPRTLSVAEGLAAVLRDRGDAAGERALLEEALRRVGDREPTGGMAKVKARLVARLAVLSK